MKQPFTSIRPLAIAVVLLQMSAACVLHAELTHRYSFNDETSSTNAVDSVGGAHGSLFPGAFYTGDGTVTLDGVSGFVYLPDDIVSNYTSITFEVWTMPLEHRNWARLFDFGTNQGGKGTGGAGGTGGDGVSWIYVATSDGDGLYRGDVNPPGAALSGARPVVGGLHHLAFTIDSVAKTAALYDNGVIVAFSRNWNATPRNVGHTYNDYIGRSQFADPYYLGTIDEFRIHNAALAPEQVVAHYEAGANAPAAQPGAIKNIDLKLPATLVLGALQTPTVLASYNGITNSIDVSAIPTVIFTSDNTNVIAVGADGRLRALNLGSATVQASYQSMTDSATVTVVMEAPVLKHRYSFAGNAGTTAITDSVGNAHGTLVNGTETATLGGGKLTLDGNFSSAYAELPAGIISKLTNATFKAWVNWDGGNAWQRIFDFGTNTGVGQNVISTYLTPRGGPGVLRWGFNFAGEQTVDDSVPLVVSNEVCVTVAYNYSSQAASLYVGGRKVASGSVNKALFNVPDGYNWLGRAKYNDPYFSGSFNEFRIYSGVESDLQIAIDAAAGPENLMTDPGALLGLTVKAATTNLDTHGIPVPVQVLANFANVANVDVTTLAETVVSSGNPSIAAISKGAILPKNVGTVSINAAYKGAMGSMAISVYDTNAWPSLLHRYAFSDPQGTTVSDSVGTIHGTFHGLGTFTGSQLVMPAGNPRPLADGTPNPNGGWVSFPGGQGMVSGLPNQASFECWVVWNGGAVWQEIFDFGQAATPGFSLGGGTYLMICPSDGVTGAFRLEWFPGGLVLVGPALKVGTLSHIVVTHDQDLQIDKLYLNGELIATGANTRLFSDLPDTDNWLARDQWPDAMFNGAYDDFRIWKGALTAGQVANLYEAGPSVIPGPEMTMSRSGSALALRWPANADGFQLEFTTNLKGGPWTPVASTPVTDNGLKEVTVNIGNVPTYYRLKQ